ncbi:sugar ABC transporter substrate-binding protein [Motiliproteus coralliicola]|uniref:Sugar ABC transporter substrate-binding protein n=1 Tax=Motiliproteus coralliicola TaxID=2283196 RepID=A0A369WMF8_9GAMM|nr:ABC transporter substrate-binding protein [Motiliproteus coralliicola]RDE22671.1 sugar ABC transporter substrate-binding protein [Motiliproteus coralliicola]
MIKTLLSLSLSTLLYSTSLQAMEVTFLNPGKQGERFWDMVTETMQAAANDLDIELEVVYAQRNRVKMVEIGQQITSRNNPPDYLILVNEEQAAEKIFLSSKGSKTKTLMLLNDFLPPQRAKVGYPKPDNPNLLGAVIPDNHGAGRRMMQALHQCAKATNDSGPYHMLAIGGDQLTPASIDRNRGAMSVIEQQADIKLDRFLYANWNQQEASDLTDSYLKWATRNDIQPVGIWAANDPIAMGARDALKANSVKPGSDVCLVGLNWSAQGLEMVRNGEMLLTDGGHFLAGAWSMVMLYDYHQRSLKGETAPLGRVDFQMQSIDRNNIDQYSQNLGDENWDKIDFRGFSLKPSQGYGEYDFSLQKVLSHIKSH